MTTLIAIAALTTTCSLRVMMAETPLPSDYYLSKVEYRPPDPGTELVSQADSAADLRQKNYELAEKQVSHKEHKKSQKKI